MHPVLPNKLELARLNTPLQPLRRLSAHLGGPTIWLKRDDLTECGLSGNKIRKLEFTLYQAIEAGCDTIITCGGIQSNHCRATALVCARLGLKCRLVLRGDMPESLEANALLDGLAGADITFVETSTYCRSLDEILANSSQEVSDSGGKAWVIPTGASDGHGVWGYLNCAAELKSDFAKAGISPGYIFTASGSGGTQAGLTVGASLYKLGASVVGVNVCDDEAWFQNKVRKDLHEWLSLYGDACGLAATDIQSLDVRVLDGYVGEGYAKAGPEVFSTLKLVANLEGIVLDPVYTGKAFHGMLDQLKQGHYQDASDIVFVHTGGIFGLFAYQNLLNTYLK